MPAPRKVQKMSALDQVIANAPKREVKSTQVNAKLSVPAHAAIREASMKSGLSMSEIVKGIIHNTLRADGVDVDAEDNE